MTTMIDSTKYRLELSRQLSASPERVFKAWLDPVAFKSWFKPNPSIEVTTVEIDPRVGGEYRFVMAGGDGQEYVGAGVYEEIVPSEKLVFTWKPCGEPDTTRVTVSLRPSGSGTELTLTHELLPSAESRDNHEKGWTSCLDSLVKHAD